MGSTGAGLRFWVFGAAVVFAGAAGMVAADSMRMVIGEDVVSVYEAGTPVLGYRYREVPYKPYVQRLSTPAGVNVLLDAPPDHPHHHGLMFAVTVDGVNFWEEQKAPGLEMHRRFVDVQVSEQDGVPYAGFSEEIDWMNPASGQVLLREQRAIEVRRLAEPEVTLLRWRSKLQAPADRKEVRLSGSHYHGLGLRFVRSMDRVGDFYNADGRAGKIFRGEERLVRSRWCAYSAKAGSKYVTVAMFDDPGNARHPATWFTMREPFGYLAGTLGLQAEPLKIKPQQPLVLRYGVVLWDGRAKAEVIEKTYRYWVSLEREAVAAEQAEE